MDLSSLLIVLLAAVMAALFIARPLLGSRPGGAVREGGEAARLRIDLEEVLARLQEMERDRASGELGEEDYAAERPRLLRQAAGLMRRLEVAETGVAYRPLEGAADAEGTPGADRRPG